MPAGAERDPLVGIFEIRLPVEVFLLQANQIHQHFPCSGLPASGEIPE
jgi:hypothetical protein